MYPSVLIIFLGYASGADALNPYLRPPLPFSWYHDQNNRFPTHHGSNSYLPISPMGFSPLQWQWVNEQLRQACKKCWSDAKQSPYQDSNKRYMDEVDNHLKPDHSEETVYDTYHFLRSLNTNENATEETNSTKGNGTDPVKDASQIPTVTRAKRSADYHEPHGHSFGPTGGWPTDGWPTGGWPSGGWPTGGWPTGGWPTGGWPTGGWPTGGWPTGRWPHSLGHDYYSKPPSLPHTFYGSLRKTHYESNPYYLYSKLAFVQQKLAKKKKHHSNHSGY